MNTKDLSCFLKTKSQSLVVNLTLRNDWLILVTWFYDSISKCFKQLGLAPKAEQWKAKNEESLNSS